jgi:long-chain acyl-CoA synthetase
MVAAIDAALTGPDAPFEIVEEDVLGVPMRVFRNRPRSARELLLASADHGSDEYIVHGDRRIRFDEHLEKVAALSSVLSDKYGVRQGDRIALLGANSPEWAITFWATVTSGATVASMNSFWSEPEIAYALSHCEPKVLVADRARLARVRSGDLAEGMRVIELDSELAELLDGTTGQVSTAPIDEDDPAVILYTSGTTGRSKGAVASHRSICGAVMLSRFSAARAAATTRATGATAAIGSKQVALITLPLFHASGLYGFVVGQLASGGSMVLRSGRFDEDDVIRLIESEKVTLWPALGSMGPRVATRAREIDCDLSSIRLLAVGGAPVSPTVQSLLRETFANPSLNISQGYTSSEGVAVVTRIQGDELSAHPTAVGRPLITTEVEIRDSHGTPVPDGTTGEIHVRSPYVMTEYWRDPEATAKVLKPGRWLYMGDLGHFEGGLLHIDARDNDMILVNAENVYPAEIEYRLDSHPEVVESAVFGVDDEMAGEAIHAVVRLALDAALATGDLAEWCAATMPAYKVPTQWELRTEPLPRNASDKIVKRALADDSGPHA